MWTLDLIERFASALAEQKSWHKCETCGTEYQSMRLAYNCWKGHRRSYERRYLDPVQTKLQRHEVAFDDTKPLCRACSRTAAGTLTVVQMVAPPKCSNCGQQIADKERPELVPPRRPVSETHRELILQPSKEALVDIERYRIHKKLKPLDFQSGHALMDEKNFDNYGPNQVDGKGAHQRAGGEYITTIPNEPIECKPI